MEETEIIIGFSRIVRNCFLRFRKIIFSPIARRIHAPAAHPQRACDPRPLIASRQLATRAPAATPANARGSSIATAAHTERSLALVRYHRRMSERMPTAPQAAPPIEPAPPPTPHATALAGAIALLAWIALALQTDITVYRMLLRGFDTFDAVLRLASYLTNLTVFLVALSFTCVTLRVRAWPIRFLAGPAAVSAVTVYMVFVGIAYNVLLRHLWTPHGYRAFVNESLHTVLPVLCAAYWLRFVPYFRLSRRERLAWFAYPLGYLVVTFWRGSVTDFYPYPFIDVGELGYTRVVVNSALLFSAFVVLMAAFTAINARRRPATPVNALSAND